MIIKSTAHGGHVLLGRHLVKTDQNESVEIRTSRGLPTDSASACAALHAISQSLSRRGTSRTLLHVSINPDCVMMSEEFWNTAWLEYESEFGLTGRPYIEAIHVKRRSTGVSAEHRHRVYSSVDPLARTVVNLDNSYSRQEAVARTIEHKLGLRMVKGRHNRKAAALLKSKGCDDVATAMSESGLLNGPPALASFDVPAETLRERQMAGRTGMSVPQMSQVVYQAWKQYTDAREFRDALLLDGITIKKGDKGVWVALHESGATSSLKRLLDRASKAAGQPLHIPQADIDARLVGLDREAIAQPRSPERKSQRAEPARANALADQLLRSAPSEVQIINIVQRAAKPVAPLHEYRQNARKELLRRFQDSLHDEVAAHGANAVRERLTREKDAIERKLNRFIMLSRTRNRLLERLEQVSSDLRDLATLVVHLRDAKAQATVDREADLHAWDVSRKLAPAAGLARLKLRRQRIDAVNQRGNEPQPLPMTPEVLSERAQRPSHAGGSQRTCALGGSPDPTGPVRSGFSPEHRDLPSLSLLAKKSFAKVVPLDEHPVAGAEAPTTNGSTQPDGCSPR